MSSSHVIVGAGEAGVAAAAAIRAHAPEAQILLLSAEDHWPYERPPLSKDVLTADPAPTLIRQPAWYKDQRIDLRMGVRVASIDADARRVGIVDASGTSEPIPYDRLLLATGSRVRRLPFEPIHYLRDWDDALELRRSLSDAAHIAIIGGGVVGLEVASSARALGRQVSVIEQAPSLMARALAPTVSDWLQKLHIDGGVTLSLGTGVRGVSSSGTQARVELQDGSAVDADLVLAGIGVTPDVALAEAAGCAVDDGILVDAAGRTSIDGIYAAGDVARFFHPSHQRHMRLEAWQHAGRHGAHVGAAMTGVQDNYSCTPWFWTDQHGINLQVAGFAENADLSVWRGEGARRTAFHFERGRLVAASAIDNGRDMRPATKLIEAEWSGDPSLLANENVALGALVRDLLAEAQTA